MSVRVFPATDKALTDALAFVEDELTAAGCSMKTLMQIQICVEEMFVNVAHYAYNGAEGTVTLNIDVENGLMTITLTDSGLPFDPLAKDDPDITLSAAERPIGGLGIFMVKKSMDEVTYKRSDNKNYITMKKDI